MNRSPVTLRAVETTDIPVLVDVWDSILRKGGPDEQRRDVADIVADVAGSEDLAILVAEFDGQIAGAVYVEATTLTPLNREPAVLAVSPHVLPQFRRKGVGSALMDGVVRFAEARGIAHVLTAANTEGRDANRFMARLALAPQATLRAAATSAVRARLNSRRPRSIGTVATARQIDRVLAVRRSRRERVPG